MDEILQTNADTALRERAIKRLKKQRDFKGHLLVYALVNAFLVLIWAMTNPDGFFWPVFPIVGWGIGVVLNAWDVYQNDEFADEVIHREMEHLRRMWSSMPPDCDWLDGPVVRAARGWHCQQVTAPWFFGSCAQDGEAKVRGVFDRALSVANSGPDAAWDCVYEQMRATAHGHQLERDHERVAGIAASWSIPWKGRARTVGFTYCGEVGVAPSWKPMLVTGVVASLVFVVDNVAGGNVDDVAAAGELLAGDQPPEPAAASPSATADAEVLPPQRDALGVITTNGVPGRTVALTFDDGPSPVHTPQVLDILDTHDVTAIFCVVGAAAQAHPEIIEDIVDGGHTLCDHTVSHDLKLSTRAEQAIHEEIDGTLDSIHAAAPDIEVPFFRAPGGYFSAGVNAVAASYEQEPLGWSVDPRDWKAPGAGRIYEVVMGGVTPGSIVLLHDGGGDQSDTVAALDDIISALDDAGYEFVIPKT